MIEVASPLIVPALVSEPVNREGDFTTYQRFSYQSFIPFENTRVTIPQKFDVSGDTLCVLDISGSENIGIRLGDNFSHFIPIKKGMVIKRPFRSVTVGVFNGQTIEGVNADKQALPTIVEFVATYGDFIVNPGEDHQQEFHAGFWSFRDAVATTVPRPLMADLISASFDRYEIGRKGATVIIRNADMVNDLYVFWAINGNAFNAGNGFRLYAGETFTMPWNDRLLRVLKDASGANLIDGLFVATTSGTCAYDWIATRSPAAYPIDIGQNQIVVDQ